VEDVFRSAGFTVRSTADLFKKYPGFPTNADKIYAELEAFRNSKDPKPNTNGAALKRVEDLYDFAAYLAGEPENAAVYRSKSTDELKSRFDGLAKEYSTRTDNFGHLCSSLATYGKTYVFDSEDHRQGYEAYLKYKNPSLTRLFSQMKSFSMHQLLEPKFAEACIKEISAVFGDYEVSLAIYNKEAGFKDEFYIPEKTIFGGGTVISAPVEGTIIRYVVNEGEKVAAGTTVLILEAFRMELDIKAVVAGNIHFLVSIGTLVAAQQPVAEINGAPSVAVPAPEAVPVPEPELLIPEPIFEKLPLPDPDIEEEERRIKEEARRKRKEAFGLKGVILCAIFGAGSVAGAFGVSSNGVVINAIVGTIIGAVIGAICSIIHYRTGRDEFMGIGLLGSLVAPAFCIIGFITGDIVRAICDTFFISSILALIVCIPFVFFDKILKTIKREK
jgi:biotin carboxyl carrier protein